MVILDMNYASFIIVYMSYCLFISSVNIFLCFDKWFDIFLSDWYIHSNPSLSWLCTGMNILNGSHSVTKQNPPGHFYALVNPPLNFDQTTPNFWPNRPLCLYLRIFELKKMVENLSSWFDTSKSSLNSCHIRAVFSRQPCCVHEKCRMLRRAH